MKKIHLDSEQQILLRRIIVTIVLTLTARLTDMTGLAEIIIYGLALLCAGYDVIWKAVTNIFHGKVFSEHFLMSVAVIGAFCIQNFPEAVAVMAFYQIGELFQDIAVDNSRRSIRSMMNLKPDFALVERDGKTERVSPQEVANGSIIVIKPGMRIPVDGIVESGESSLDTAALTGESMPLDVSQGDNVLSGSVNINGVLRIRTTTRYEESTAARILKILDTAENGKAPTERFITRFARWYTPIVVGLAALLFIIPPLAGGGSWLTWLNRALIFLVISCPCALVVSVPLTFFAGIGGAARRNILFKGSTYFEAMSKVRTMVFDKTGTLTNGTFSISSIDPIPGIERDTLLRLGAVAEKFSTHPVAKALREAYPGNETPSDVKEFPGEGIKATIDGKEIYAGNLRLMQRAGCTVTEENNVPGTIILIAEMGKYLGSITVSDTINPQAAKAIDELKQEGVAHLMMLTGDHPGAASHVAAKLGIHDWRASLLPQDKMKAMANMKKSSPKGEKRAFVGDGINDAPTLAIADVGIAMGALGSDAAIEAADVVLGNDNLRLLPVAVKISRRTLHIVWQNIIFAIAVKVTVMIFASLGLADMWWAVFADVGVTALAVLNALRALHTKKL